MNRVLIVVSPRRFMRWHERLRDSLAKRWPEAQVAFRLEAQKDDEPGSVIQLLSLERLILARGRPALCDRLPPRKSQIACEGAKADLLVDLTGKADGTEAARVLRPLYDGFDTDHAAFAAILSGDSPHLAIEEVATGEIIAEGRPSLECEPTLMRGLDAVYSRIAFLIEQAIATPRPPSPRPSANPRHPPTPTGYFLKCLAHRAASALFHLCCHSPHWRIGWRYNDGPGALETGTLAGPDWIPLYDNNLGFAADPFPIQWGGGMGVFFESMDYRSGKGAINFQPFGERGPIGEAQTVLSEPWHLSYPFLIEEAGALYMVPEASASGAITLYRCIQFPSLWEPVCKLVDNIEAADATIFKHGGRYWMTSVIRDGYGGYSDTLAIHHASSLFGPWRPHALSPVLVDSRFARPAGAVVTTPQGLCRPVQDCSRGYGKGVASMRIDALDPDHFGQSVIRTLYPDQSWPGGRLHTINRAGRLEFIDGTVFAPKHLPLRRIWTNRVDSRLHSPSSS